MNIFIETAKKPLQITTNKGVGTDAALKASWIVKRTKLYQFDILLILRLLWHERTTLILKDLRIQYSTITGPFPPSALLSTSGTVISIRHANIQWKNFKVRFNFSKMSCEFPNENKHKTDCKYRPQWVGDEETFSL